MEPGPKEIIIIFNSRNNAHKEASAYAHILSGKVRQYDITKTRFSSDIIFDLARRLNVEVLELLDVEGELFHRLRLREDRLDNESGLALILEYPELLKSPILLMRNMTMFVRSKDDIMNLAMV